MQCPACRTSPLQPTKLDDGLLAHGCPQCSGALVAWLYYRDWAERQPQNDEPQAQVAAEAASESQQALSCPKCAKLMSKFQISGTRANRPADHRDHLGKGEQRQRAKGGQAQAQTVATDGLGQR